MPPRNARTNAAKDPEKAQADIAQIMDPIPDPPEPVDDLVRLPGGLSRKDGVIRTATVRELNGFDEEALSKALKSNNIIHFVDVLISCGTATIGSEPATPEMLKNLLLGDRDELFLAIRRATYGDTVTLDRWKCPHCGSVTPISFSITDDIERKRLEDPAENLIFDVELRKGGTARVRLPNGGDQMYIYDDDDLTPAQQNSRLLTRCVLSYTSPDGKQHVVAARPSLVLELPITDRQKIIAEIAKRQPGPKYNGVTFTHQECGNEVVLALGVADFFRDLILYL
jgi:hypothetical protein